MKSHEVTIQEVRRRLLWAGGLRDLPDVPPGQGCTAFLGDRMDIAIAVEHGARIIGNRWK